MNSGLWLLLRLQARGWGRSLTRGLKSVRGALLVLVGLVVVGSWMFAVLQAPRGSGLEPGELRKHGAAVFLSYCLLSVLLSRGERGIYFNPAEVDFLFAGPFTRRELLLYKIASGVMVGLPTTLFLTILLQIHADWFLAAFLGLFLAFLFVQLFTMAVSLLAITIGTQAFTRARRIFLAVLIAVAVVLLFLASREAGGGLAAVFGQIEDTPGWKVATAPIRWYIEAFLVEQGDWLALAQWGGLSLAVTLVFLGLVLWLDTNYIESAAAVSARVYAQLQKIRRGEGVSLHWPGSGSAAWGLPSLPWWGGIGPIAWRQATTAIRSLGRVALVLLLVAPVMVGPMFGHGEEGPGALMLVGGLLVWLSMLLSTLVPFDFRGDLERMEVLKTLPIPASRIVVGQLLAPVALLFLLQSICLLSFWPLMSLDPEEVFWGIACALPVDFLLVGLDNVMFLWFPSRTLAANPADFQAVGRNVLMLLAKAVVLGGAGAAAFGVGLLTALLTEYHWQVGIFAAWLTLAAFAATMIPLAALAFINFDVSRHRPA